MRVVFLSDAIQGRNGVGTYYQDLTAHLESRVERVALIAPDLHRPESHQGLSFPIPGDATQRMYFPRFRHLPRLLQEIDPQVVVIPTIGPYSLLGLWHARRMGAAICVAHHTEFDKLAELYCNRFFGPLCRHGLEWIAYSVLSAGSIVATNNAKTVAAIQGMGMKDVRLVGTSIAKPFLSVPTKPLAGELRSVVYVGRLAPEKNLDCVVAAAERLPEIRFIICGDGPLRPLVERSAGRLPNLEYKGWVQREELVRVLDDAEMLLLPSSVESFGTVAMEAMARGRLVLVSRQCGIAQWEGLAGSLFYVEAGEPLADAISRVAGLDWATRHRAAEQGRAAAQSANAATVDDWMQILNELACPNELPAPLSVRRA